MTDAASASKDRRVMDVGASSQPSESSPRGLHPCTGSFRFWFASRRWEWSPEVYRMHGYTPGAVEPTTQLLSAHKHPDDRDHVADAIAHSVDSENRFSSRHRFIDTAGHEHQAMVIADRIVDDDGNVVGTAGFYIDLDQPLAEVEQTALEALLPELVEARAVIEQTKGVLMRMYRISADQAFKVLRWRSQETNVKLRLLAEQLVHDLPSVPPASPEIVAGFDHILLTLHERIPKTE